MVFFSTKNPSPSRRLTDEYCVCRIKVSHERHELGTPLLLMPRPEPRRPTTAAVHAEARRLRPKLPSMCHVRGDQQEAPTFSLL